MSKLVKEYLPKPIQLEGFHSKVSIIVPFHGQYEKVARLIESIYRYTHTSAYQICLIDDASPNSDFLDEMTKIPSIEGIRSVKCIRRMEQKGYGSAIQVGLQKTTNPWCVFMHSDCRVEDVGWLKSLGDALLALKSKGVRMIGARTNSCSNGDPRQEAEKGTTCEDVILTDTNLATHCFMCHRDLFKHTGFIKNYPFAGFEDEEFAYRMRKHGYKQAISGKSWIHHENGATIKSVCRKDPKILDIINEENRKKALSDIKLLQK